MNIKILLFALVGIVAVQLTFATAPIAGREIEIMPTYVGRTDEAKNAASQYRDLYMEFVALRQLGVRNEKIRDLTGQLGRLERYFLFTKDENKKPVAVRLEIPSKLWFELEFKNKRITDEALKLWKKGELFCNPCQVGLDKGGIYFRSRPRKNRTYIPRQDNSSAPLDTGGGREEKGADKDIGKN